MFNRYPSPVLYSIRFGAVGAGRCWGLEAVPVLIETFVETPRFTGALYKASGWTRVGTTQGRGATTGTTGATSP